jgi:hypothetical protein
VHIISISNVIKSIHAPLVDSQHCYSLIFLTFLLKQVLNGILKWHFHEPRPGWVDKDIKLREWSDEYSFPSSHAQIVWSLANFFTFTSISSLRTRLLGVQLGTAAATYWYEKRVNSIQQKQKQKQQKSSADNLGKIQFIHIV